MQLKTQVQELLALAEERYRIDKARYDEKMAQRAAREKERGKKLGGKVPKAPERERHSEPPPLAVDASAVQAMAHRLKTKAGRALYALRKQSIETVFGIIKSVMGFRQFSLRGFKQVSGEWALVCLAWNFKRLAVLRPKFG